MKETRPMPHGEVPTWGEPWRHVLLFLAVAAVLFLLCALIFHVLAASV
jgi:hypothetical protein